MIACLLAACALVASLGAPASARAAAGVDFRRDVRTIDGFGFSEAFQRANVMRGLFGLSKADQREVLRLLFDRRTGAGASVLRLGIGSSSDDVYDHMRSIEPVDPGGPDAPPRYVWDGEDNGQVWLARQAHKYGVRRYYADAWSAPGFMKTNGDDANGGTLCGLSGTNCPSGDWRAAYARYLVQYTRFYHDEGIRITDLGFTNEPDLTVSYASMRFTPAQATEFTRILGPLAAADGLGVACCEATGWDDQTGYTQALLTDPAAARWIGTITGHAYEGPITGPQPARRPVWMSEWAPTGWNEHWDDGSDNDGITVAEHIHNALTTGDASGYLYWLGASRGGTGAFIQLVDGGGYEVSRRLWAFAAYSRFVRPGATRVAVRSGDPALRVTAFRNPGGGRVIEIINTAAAGTTANLTLNRGGRPRAYLTDETHALTPVNAAQAHGRDLTVSLAPRSLTTVVLR